jgi:hypothetical protein
VIRLRRSPVSRYRIRYSDCCEVVLFRCFVDFGICRYVCAFTVALDLFLTDIQASCPFISLTLHNVLTGDQEHVCIPGYSYLVGISLCGRCARTVGDQPLLRIASSFLWITIHSTYSSFTYSSLLSYHISLIDCHTSLTYYIRLLS